MSGAGQVSGAVPGLDPTVVTHFVLTRFNVRMPIYQHPGDEWLPERVELFERFCLPTLRAQTQKRFHWLVFVDAASPRWLLDRLEADLVGLGEVVEVDGLFTGETAARAVRERLHTPWVVTTRLDNDDAVADDFVETVQGAFHHQELEFVNLVSGAQHARRRVYLRPYTRNPFISLVEAAGPGPLRGVFVKRHYELDTVARVVNVKTRHPAWLQVVHGDNVLTELVGLRTRARRVVPYFSCSLDVEPDGLGLVAESAVGAARILWRLGRRPRRLLDLAQAVLADGSRSVALLRRVVRRAALGGASR